VISDAMAKRFWPNEDPIGKHLTLTFSPDHPREIVGVVGDVKQDGLSVSDPNATLYIPMAQITAASYAASAAAGFGGFRGGSPMTLVVRTTTRPASVAPAVTNALRELDASTPLLDVVTLEDYVAESLSQERFNMLLLATFAGLAVVLAAVGIYSVLAYTVRRCMREIGIRMALGAQISDVLRMIVYDGMRATLIGVGFGLAGALILGRVLSTLVYGVSTTDVATFASVSVLLTAVGLLASVVPAYRASRIEPVRTLRDE
jgi:putative ABC transport system permease protein